jgi:hypothetical protein
MQLTVHWQYGGATNIFSTFLFANQLWFQQTNNGKQQNKQWAFLSLISSGNGQTENRMLLHRQCFNVGGNIFDPTI